MGDTTALALGAMPRGSSPDEWLAAGPFCFTGQEEHFPDWERRFRFAPEPLANPHILAHAAKVAQSLCLAVIPELARRLAPVNSAHTPEYWQTLLCPWTIDLARQLVERCLRSKAMVEAWGKMRLNVALLPENCEFVFRDEHDFTLRGNLGQNFNHWLFSRILENMWPGCWKRSYLPGVSEHPEADSKAASLARLKKLVRHYLLYLNFPRLKGMSFAQALLFSNALRHPIRGGGGTNLWKNFFRPELLESVELPENYLGIFEKCIPLSIRDLKHAGRREKKINKPFLKVVSPAAYEDSSYRQDLALWKEKGNALAWAQHGGNYGQVRTCCEAEIVEYSQDFFFTWGWDHYENACGNFVPMPYPQLANVANAWRGKTGRIIFVGTEMAAYGYRLDSHPTPLQYVAYRQWKADFLEALPVGLREKIWYRPYFPLPGTLADAAWLMPRFPELRLCKGDLLPQLLDCRLLVLDHHGTTLLEAMAANVPMILYWNRAHWLLCKECEKLLDMLEACGIWHPTPQGAARKLAEVWPHVGDWWREPAIVSARKLFCQHQARLPDGSLNKAWIEVLQNL